MKWRRRSPRSGWAPRALCLSATVVLGTASLAGDAGGQSVAPLVVRGPEGSTASLPVDRSRGYASVSVETLMGLGWVVEPSASGLMATSLDGGSVVEFSFGAPLFRWNGQVLQFVDAPFVERGTGHIPLQFVLDFLPVRLEGSYALLEAEGALQIRDAAVWAGLARNVPTTPPDASLPRPPEEPPVDGGPRVEGGSSSGAKSFPADQQSSGDGGGPTPTARNESGSPPAADEARTSGAAEAPGDPDASGDGNVSGDGSASGGGSAAGIADAVDAPPVKRVVVIDPGHGGKDPGTSGPGGRREKDIALAVGRALARELRGDETLEVHLTRDRDVLVPLWRRGELATEWKGDRPGVFISIHANALPNRNAVRGFETYFLSEARTEHELRVAANENAPLEIDREDGAVEGDEEDLGFILRELRNLDHTHWSSLLAEGVQGQLATVHPGPSRGVKQAPLAVITNALMPAVLVEVGFVTNREEERLLSRGEFQAHLAEAMGRAIRDFFERYPPGLDETVTGPRP